MFQPGKVAQALEDKVEVFRASAQRTDGALGCYRRALAELETFTPIELAVHTAAHPWPGAQRVEPGPVVIPFSHTWTSLQEARRWAVERLRGVATVAVDGSQIAASKEFGVPISLVQVAFFENYHRPDRPYIKDVRDEVLMPDDRGEEMEEYVFAESFLNQRRFALEMEVAAERMTALPADPVPLCLIDGSLVLSFIGRSMEAVQRAYLVPLLSLLGTSERRRVPLAGYIDLSYAADVVNLLRLTCDLPPAPVFDAQVLTENMAPLDRSAVFACARGDVLPLYGTHAHDICFVYLKAGSERLPARIDFPRWIWEAGLIDHMTDVIRAEIIVGGGYPYALETADATAVLTMEDRLRFYDLYRSFARQSGLPASIPRKTASKLARR